MVPQTTVICAVWHQDAERHQLLQTHQANLERQTVPLHRIYVFDNNDTPPAGLHGTKVVVSERLSIFQAWNVALSLVATPYVLNLNLDDRLAPDALAKLEAALQTELRNSLRRVLDIDHRASRCCGRAIRTGRDERAPVGFP